jgi:hypothetical protein
MAEHNLTLTADECKYLIDLLERTLRDTEIEEHRTRAPAYREHILQWEELAKEILKKLKS